MASLERSVFGFLGTLLALAWAMHEMAHLDELSRRPPEAPPAP